MKYVLVFVAALVAAVLVSEAPVAMTAFIATAALWVNDTRKAGDKVHQVIAKHAGSGLKKLVN